VSITTQDGALAGAQALRPIVKALSGTLVAGRFQSFWPVAGVPGAGAYDATLNGAVLSSSSTIPAGAIPHTDPGSGNSYLLALELAAAQPGVILLLDRLWNNQLTVNSTAAQSITSPTWPARDAAGSTNGDGVLLAIETSAAASATAAALTVSYTNQAGTAGRTGSFTYATAASSTLAGAMFPISLQAGDTGVRSVQTVTFSTAWTTGTINLVAYRLLATIPAPTASASFAKDGLSLGFQRLYNGVVPYLAFVPSTTTTTGLQGSFVETQG
jgi:hypothetical protein